MQRYPDDLSESERKIARRWTLGSVGLYGSLLALLALYATFSPGQGGSVASRDGAAKYSVASATRDPAAQRPVRALPSRHCGASAC